MTQEDKELLLKDLCARLPYGVKIAYGQYDKNPRNVNSISIVDIGTFFNGYFNKGIKLDFNGNKELWPKPYLQTMSSMTEEEKEELYHYYCNEIADNLNTPNLTWEVRCCISNSFGTDGEYYWFAKDVMTKHYNNPVDACMDMIIKLKELNLL